MTPPLPVIETFKKRNSREKFVKTRTILIMREYLQVVFFKGNQKYFDTIF